MNQFNIELSKMVKITNMLNLKRGQSSKDIARQFYLNLNNWRIAPENYCIFEALLLQNINIDNLTILQTTKEQVH